MNALIEQCGGYAASIEFLKSARDARTQEHAAILVSRLAVNSKMRSEYQKNPAVAPLLQKAAREGNEVVKSAALLACNNVAVPRM